MSALFRVSVSRRFWPWPKRYVCESIAWGGPDVPAHIMGLDLPDHRRVFIDTAGRTITYGPEVWAWKVREMEKQAGQPMPLPKE
jgi:hypothetical protein